MSYPRGRGRGRGFFKFNNSHRHGNPPDVSAANEKLPFNVSTQSIALTPQDLEKLNAITVKLTLDVETEEWLIKLRNLWNLCKCDVLNY